MADVALSTLKQDPLPVGTLQTFIGNRLANFTIGVREYLRTGALKTYSGDYASTVASMPDLGVVLATTGYAAPSGLIAIVKPSGSYYYLMSSGAASQYNYATTLLGTTTAATLSTNTTGGVTDMAAIGAYVLFSAKAVSGAGGLAYTNSNVTPTDIALTGNCHTVVVNAAETLAVVVKLLSGSSTIYTSTDGATWTARTPSGGAAVASYYAMWSPVSSTFLHVGGNAVVYSSTNGYTLTSRGVCVTSATAVAESDSGIFPSGRCAASATSTMFVVKATVGGVADYYVVRTTNGTSFSSTKVSDLFAVFNTVVIVNTLLSLTGLKLAYIDDTYFLYTATQQFSGFILKSVDDGVTWTIANPIVVDPGQTVSSIKKVASSYVGFNTASRLGVFADFDTVTHVGSGVVVNSDEASGQGITKYIRIK